MSVLAAIACAIPLAILSFKLLPLRAASTLVLLTVVLLSGLAVLIPQSLPTLGVELWVLTGMLIAMLVRYFIVRHLVDKPTWLVVPILVVFLPTVLFAVAGALAVADNLDALYFAAGAVGFGIAGAVLNVWVLMVEIKR